MVKKRALFYLSGYDPRGVRYYHSLYKKESKKQTTLNGLTIEVSSRKRISPHIDSWKITAKNEDKTIETMYLFLGYDDIIRKRWKRSVFELIKDMWFYVVTYFFTGTLFRLIQASPAQAIPLIYPVLYLVVSLVFVVWLLLIGASFLSAFIPFVVALMVLVYPLYKLLEIFLDFGEKITVFWLLRIYLFSAHYAKNEIENIDERIELFVSHIVKQIDEASKNGVDEVLIVAHSVGSILLISILQKVLSTIDSQKKLPQISIVTLGQCIPLVSFLKSATTYKNQMKDIVSYNNFTWIDYSSKIDGASAPFLDYFKHANIKTKGKNSPYYLSTRFHLLYDKNHYKQLKKNRFVVHFLYLMSTDKQGEYDFFKITSGCTFLKNYIKDKKSLV